MSVTTVKGEISPSDLGITLPHEHLLLDSSAWSKIPEETSLRKLLDSPVEMSNLGILRLLPYAVKSNAILDDIDLVIEELLYYKRRGGRSIVDMSSIGLGRDHTGLRAISEETGVNVVAGCGYYMEHFLPSEYKNRTQDELAQKIITEVRDGIDDSGIRPGIIGEIGTTPNVTDFDVRLLQACSKAQVETGLSMVIHNEFSRSHGRILDILEKSGVDLHRVVLAHLDSLMPILTDIGYLEGLLKRGAYVEFDGFGWCTQVYSYLWKIGPLWDGQYPRDVDKVKIMKTLIDKGYLEQILISHDTANKNTLKKYGGVGYDLILGSVVPFCKQYGITDEQIGTILVSNPAKLLAH